MKREDLLHSIQDPATLPNPSDMNPVYILTRYYYKVHLSILFTHKCYFPI